VVFPVPFLHSSYNLCQSVSLDGLAQFWLIGEVKKQNTYILINKKTNIMTIKPLADRVLVVPAPAEEKIGGIIIPDTAKEKPLRGIIKAVGKGTKDEEMILKAGDEVLYGKYSGTEIELDGEKFLMMRQSDVLAVIC
jgi:chaperonin GroES